MIFPNKFNYLKPKVLNYSPEWLEDDVFTFDDFVSAKSQISIQKSYSNSQSSEKTTIYEAAKNMRGKINGSKQTFSLSADDDLDKLFHLPTGIKAIDLYTNFSLIKEATSYLRERSKLFHGFMKGYNSAPYQAYGGMSEWIHLISGEITVTLYKPTPLNVDEFLSWDPDYDMRPEFGTVKEYLLKPKSLLYIPAGWITIIKAQKHSFAFGGEFLHYKTLTHQLYRFDKNVEQCLGKYAIDRDREIRFVYWFFAAKLMSDPGRSLLKTIDDQSIEIFLHTLGDWRKKHLAKREPLNIYAPSGMQICSIWKDIGKTLKSSKNPVNILVEKGASNN